MLMFSKARSTLSKESFTLCKFNLELYESVLEVLKPGWFPSNIRKVLQLLSVLSEKASPCVG